MALILDKNISGVTSVDTSGNTLTTGYTNMNYEDEFGNVYENPYLVVDNFVMNKLLKLANINVSMYKNSDSRDNMKEPFKNETVVLSYDENLYDTYFSIENMEGGNVFQAVYDFISTEQYINWKSDE